MLSSLLFPLAVTQLVKATNVELEFPYATAKSILLNLGLSGLPETGASLYKKGQFVFHQNAQGRAITAMYFVQTGRFYYSSEPSSPSRYAGEPLPERTLLAKAKIYLDNEAVKTFLPAQVRKSLSLIPRTEPSNPLLVVGWQATVNGYPAAYEGDYLRVTLVRSSGLLQSIEMRRGSHYTSPPTKKLSPVQARLATTKALGRSPGTRFKIDSRLQYHLFGDTKTRQHFQKTGQRKLRLGYYFDEQGKGSCFVDCETGYVDVIAR